MIPPVSHTNLSEDTCTTQTDAVDPETNENVTHLNINDGTTEITAESKTNDECNETLSKNMNSIQLAEQVASELSLSVDNSETLPTSPTCPRADDTEDAHHEETPVTFEEDATERCPTGNYLCPRLIFHIEKLCETNIQILKATRDQIVISTVKTQTTTTSWGRLMMANKTSQSITFFSEIRYWM